MKKPENIPAAIFAVALLAGLGYYVYVTDVRDYLAAEPRGYLYLALIAVGGGIAALTARRAPVTARRRLVTVARGVQAALWCAAAVWLILTRASLIWIIVCLGIMTVNLFQIASNWRPRE